MARPASLSTLAVRRSPASTHPQPTCSEQPRSSQASACAISVASRRPRWTQPQPAPCRQAWSSTVWASVRSGSEAPAGPIRSPSSTQARRVSALQRAVRATRASEGLGCSPGPLMRWTARSTQLSGSCRSQEALRSMAASCGAVGPWLRSISEAARKRQAWGSPSAQAFSSGARVGLACRAVQLNSCSQAAGSVLQLKVSLASSSGERRPISRSIVRRASPAQPRGSSCRQASR